MLGAFFYGYMVTQIPGGILAEQYGGKWVFGIGVLLTDFFCILSPVAARYGGVSAFVAIRVLTGLAEVYKYLIDYSIIIYFTNISSNM